MDAKLKWGQSLFEGYAALQGISQSNFDRYSTDDGPEHGNLPGKDASVDLTNDSLREKNAHLERSAALISWDILSLFFASHVRRPSFHESGSLSENTASSLDFAAFHEPKSLSYPARARAENIPFPHAAE